MFPAPSPKRASRTQPIATGDTVRLRMVDSDAYNDWESVYRDNIDRLYRLMYSKVGNRSDAEDLTSEVFKNALGPLRMGSSKGEVRSYLLTTAQTVLAGHWRRTLGLSVTCIDPETDRDYLAEPPIPEESSAPLQRLTKILAELPDRYRRILELRFLEACTIKESAEALNVSVANAKVLQHRALRMAAKVGLEVEG